jgi:hypothetical protein
MDHDIYTLGPMLNNIENLPNPILFHSAAAFFSQIVFVLKLLVLQESIATSTYIVERT